MFYPFLPFVLCSDILKKVGKSLTDLPDGFTLHRRLKKVFNDRAKMTETGEGIDWFVNYCLVLSLLTTVRRDDWCGQGDR